MVMSEITDDMIKQAKAACNMPPSIAVPTLVEDIVFPMASGIMIGGRAGPYGAIVGAIVGAALGVEHGLSEVTTSDPSCVAKILQENSRETPPLIIPARQFDRDRY
jgi:hypothetical protein